jgi:hypothetical protein
MEQEKTLPASTEKPKQITSLERLQKYSEIRVANFGDVFALAESGMKGLAGMAREHGEKKVHAILCLVIANIQHSFNVTNKMSETQIEEAADIIREEFYFLTPADFQLFSKGAKSGKFGESFNRLDAQVICTMLRGYVEERLERAQYNSKKEHRQLKESEKLTPEQVQEFKARFYNGADDLFQKIKANDEEPDEKEARFQKWKRDEFAKNIPVAEKIRLKEKELEDLKRQMIEDEEAQELDEEADRIAEEEFYRNNPEPGKQQMKHIDTFQTDLLTL